MFIMGFLVLFVGVPLAISLYTAPTCFDGVKNQGEAGVDCGGPCDRVCDFQASQPIVLWQRLSEVNRGVYAAVAYIENPNFGIWSPNVEYVFRFYNNEIVEPILEYRNNTYIPPESRFPIYAGTFRFDEGSPMPDRVFFDIERSSLEWWRMERKNPEVSIENKVLVHSEVLPRLQATLRNNSINNYRNVEAISLITDQEGNAVAFSRTFIDHLARGSTAELVYTWPNPFDSDLGICINPVDAVLIIDRSGSMAADSRGELPFQPLEKVKKGAKSFVNKMTPSDRLAVVSFATEGYLELGLTHNHKDTANAIDAITIHFERGTQYTNTGDALLKAYENLKSERLGGEREQVIIFLTDGEEPNRPLDPENEKYPEEYALSVADEIKDSGIRLYSIGLGSQFDGSFLQILSSSPDHYYAASSPDLVTSIYEEIALSICKQGPLVIEVVPRVNVYDPQ
jgi:hypothetical protein